jgi:cell division protein FtsQ
MRTVSSPPASPSPLPPGTERRKQLSQKRRRERLRNLWRTLLLSLAAAGLGYGLLRQGWSLQRPEQVEVSGSERVSRDQVIRAAKLRFPVPLLSLEPRRLRTDLAATLPVEQVQVQRLMLPPRLRVDLVDREAIARAERRTASGVEQGYVDRFGHWISSSQQVAGDSRKPEPTILVTGWQERHRSTLTQVLARRGTLGSPLQQIRFEPSGTLWLVTEALGQVRMGPPDGQLGRRLDVLTYLSGQLPARVRGRQLQSIDLSDPEQPELGLPGVPTAPAPAKAKGTAAE